MACRFSYLDGGDDRPVLLLLHAHWMGASDFEDVAPALADGWRIVALDQRGHGETDHGGAHSIQAYIGDVDALLDAAGINGPIVLLGHSFGGMVANLYAAARPDRVRGVILEDIDVARDDHHDFMLAWSGVYPSREALEERSANAWRRTCGSPCARPRADGRSPSNPQEVLDSKAALNGDHWAEWLSHRCPALVIGGANSRVVSGETLAEMARRRPDTRLATIDAGHCVHVDKPAEFVEAVPPVPGDARLGPDTGDAMIEGPADQPWLTSAADWKRLVEACASRAQPGRPAPPANLPPGFCDLSTGIAGECLQKWRNYRIRVAVLAPARHGVLPSSRFAEMLAEESGKGAFRIFETRESAVEWLEEIGDEAGGG